MTPPRGTSHEAAPSSSCVVRPDGSQHQSGKLAHTQAPSGLPSPLIPSPLIHRSGQRSGDSRRKPQFGAPATDRDVTDPQSVRSVWPVWVLVEAGATSGRVNARRDTGLAWGGGGRRSAARAGRGDSG